MIKVKLDNLEAVNRYLQSLKLHRPYAWGDIRYHRQAGDDWCFYSSKPKPNDYKLYKIPK